MTGVRGMLDLPAPIQGPPHQRNGQRHGHAVHRHLFYELFKFYDVDNIIRIGSAGSYTEKAKLFDVVLSTGAVSESNTPGYKAASRVTSPCQPEPERQAARFCRQSRAFPH